MAISRLAGRESAAALVYFYFTIRSTLIGHNQPVGDALFSCGSGNKTIQKFHNQSAAALVYFYFTIRSTLMGHNQPVGDALFSGGSGKETIRKFYNQFIINQNSYLAKLSREIKKTLSCLKQNIQ